MIEPYKEEAEERLSQLFGTAFDVDHPAMLDWILIRFELKRLRRVEAEHDKLKAFITEAAAEGGKPQ